MQKADCYVVGAEILIPLIAPQSQTKRPHFHSTRGVLFFCHDLHGEKRFWQPADHLDFKKAGV